MKIIVKTLAGKQLPIEIEITWTIKQVKDEIQKCHDLKADTLKLIAYGKVLDKDELLASDYSLKEGDFIVAMVQKPKPAPKPKKEDVKEEEKPVAPKEEAPKEEAKPAETASTQPAAATSSAGTGAEATQPPAEQVLTPEEEAAITELMSISGKPRDMCIQALHAAHNIPDVAFEYLISGNIPQVPEGGEDMYGEEEGMPGGEGAGMGGGLANYNIDAATMQQINALVNNPSFPMIRQRMIQDPNFSAQFMQQLSQSQPQIFNAIQQNPGILMSLILGHDPMAGMHGGQSAGGGGGGGQQHPPPGSIQVSQDEMNAIQRLEQLGFPKARAAEAFFACDKNEEMAANFLLEAGMEDEDIATQNAIAASQQEMIGGDAGAGAGGDGAGDADKKDDKPEDDKPNNNKEGGAGGDADMGGEGGEGGSSLT